jgi:hypothetical protein
MMPTIVWGSVIAEELSHAYCTSLGASLAFKTPFVLDISTDLKCQPLHKLVRSIDRYTIALAPIPLLYAGVIDCRS